jgi:F-type H+-transporting ATPase subunit b
MSHFDPFFILMSENHGEFGFNTNLLETNIINLAAVLAIVISFVGNNFTTLLEERRKTIINNLQEANQRALEAQEKLTTARQQFELAKKKAEEIRNEGVLKAEQELKNCVSEHDFRITRLNELKDETLQFYQQKAFKQASSYVISRIMSRVRERLNTGLDTTAQIIVNNFYLLRLTDFINNSLANEIK